MRKRLFILLIVAFAFVGLVFFFFTEKDKVEVATTTDAVFAFKVGYMEQLDSKKLIISNYDTYKFFFENNAIVLDEESKLLSTDEVLKKYSTTFFDNKSLAIIYKDLDNNIVVTPKVAVILNDTVTINYETSDEVVEEIEKTGYYIIAEIPKNVTMIN